MTWCSQVRLPTALGPTMENVLNSGKGFDSDPGRKKLFQKIFFGLEKNEKTV